MDRTDPVARLPEEWAELLAAAGERPFRARQLFRWIHARGETSPASMTDLPVELRGWLTEQGLAPPARVALVHRSTDGTRKLVLELAEAARVECVLIPMTRGPGATADADAGAVADDDDDPLEPDEPRQRVTLCLSTQHGCAMACGFCASGRLGLQRGLSAGEIVSQVLIARRHLDEHELLRNLVFMGMGEPLHHYQQTERALRLLTHPDGQGMSPRRITVSTVGLVPGIERLGRDFEGKIGLAISLHAPDDATRDRLVPINRRYPLSDLIGALTRYPLPRRRRITIEYTLIDGVNDDPAQARALTRLLRPVRVKVNLIPLNPVAGSPYRASPPPRVQAFQRTLTDAGLSCFVRTRRGDDVAAACGQLALAASPLGRR